MSFLQVILLVDADSVNPDGHPSKLERQVLQCIVAILRHCDRDIPTGYQVSPSG